MPKSLNLNISIMAKMTKNLDVQSNVVLLARQDLNLYEKRILIRIIQSFQKYARFKLDSIKADKWNFQIQEELFNEQAIFTFQLKDLDDDNNYGRVKLALKKLRDRGIFAQYKDHKNNKIELYTGIIENWKSINQSTIEVGINTTLYNMLLDFKDGYTKLMLSAAIKFTSVYTIRLYELISKWKEVGTFEISLEEFRRFSNTLDKFSKIDHLKQKVLNHAKQELDTSTETDLRFTYEDVKMGRIITGFKFKIEKTAQNIDIMVNNKTKLHQAELEHINQALPQHILDFCEKLEIGLKGKNLIYFQKFYKKHTLNYMKKLDEIKERALRSPDRTKWAGYIIGAIKKDLGTIKKD